jgi:hypothetical protein
MSSITDSMLVINFSTGTWSARKAEQDAQLHIAEAYGNRRDAAKVYKNLMKCDELDAWRKNRDQARQCVNLYTTPYLNDGERLIPLKLFDRFIQEFRQYDQAAPELRKAFLDAYPERCKEQAQILGKLYRESDYPSVESIANKFRFEVDFYPPRPDARDFRADLEDEYVEKVKESLTETLNETHNVVLNECLDRILNCVEKWYERVADEDKVLHESVMVTGVQELVELLPSLNVTDDPDITRLTSQMKLMLSSFDLEELRYDYDVRAEATRLSSKLLQDIRQVVMARQRNIEA